MSNTVFINLPTADLATSTRFYEALGCRKNEQFSDHTSSSMIWTDEVTFHLMTRDYFQSFATRPVGRAHDSVQMMVALGMDSREAVDRIAEAAAGAGGRADPREPRDLGFMYNRAVEDPDGHLFELIWMSPEGMAAELDRDTH